MVAGVSIVIRVRILCAWKRRPQLFVAGQELRDLVCEAISRPGAVSSIVSGGEYITQGLRRC